MNILVERIDHLGIVSGIMKDLKISEIIDEKIGTDKQEIVTSGEAVSAMILNGLGFSDRPLTLTPQFFENKPIELLIGKGILPEHLNRTKLGRVLDSMSEYGEKLISEVAFNTCIKEKVNLESMGTDTTTFSVEGEYLSDSDLYPVTITYGYSKDKRSDLKQVVLELISSFDGGIPIMAKVCNGNASDNKIFLERTKELIELFKNSEGMKYLIADSKLYTKSNAPYLNQIKFITRIPETINEAKIYINKAIEENKWKEIDNGYKFHRFEVQHYGMNQQWIVFHSEKAKNRVKETVKKEVEKEEKKIKKDLFHLQASRFKCSKDANRALYKLSKKWKFFQIENQELIEHKIYNCRGRPKKNISETESEYQIEAKFKKNELAIINEVTKRSCFIIGTNDVSEKFTPQDVLKEYKSQGFVERGFAFLKSPTFFTSSFYVKKPSRIKGLLMVMVLALLVYSIAQRRLRNLLKLKNLTVPNQINQPIQNPTMRWIFQLFEGIDLIIVKSKDIIKKSIGGINDFRKFVIELLGGNVQQIYFAYENEIL